MTATDARRLLVLESALPDDSPHVAGSMQRLCRAAVRALPAAGMGVSMLSSEGAPVSTAASDPASRSVEELQFTLGEGPGPDAFSTQRPVLVPDLMGDGVARWPGYVSAAGAQGVGAVFAFPLQIGAARLGVLHVYHREAGALSAPALARALTFAELAVELLLDAQQQADESSAAPALDDALSTGFELYQAQGTVMYQLGVDLGEAMSRVRAYAFAHERRLGDVAAAIVDRRLVLEADGPDDGTAPNHSNGEMSMGISAERLAEVFVQVADTLVDEFDLIEFLQMVTSQTSALVDARDAGLLLADHHGRLQLMAASDERTQMLELFQVQTVEGPCQDCYREGQPVVNADLRDASDRWPKFAPRAVEAGFRSVHAFPLRLRKEVIGALNLFGDDVGQMEQNDVAVVQAFADVATIGLMQERAVRRGEVLSEQLQAALNSRIVIEQAKGALAQIHSSTTDEAFTLLRAFSRRNNLRLGDVATAVITDPARHPELTQAGR